MHMHKYMLISALLLSAAGCEKEQPTVAPVEDASTSATKDEGGARTASHAVDKRTVASPVRFELASNGLPTTEMWKCDPEVADINGDGHMDFVAIPRLSDGPRVWLGDGEGNWTDASEGLRQDNSCGGGVQFVDVNQDQLLDLAVADHCNGIFVYLGNGGESWELVAQSIYPESVVTDESRSTLYFGSEDLDVADVTGDGLVDIVAGAADLGGINIYQGDGTGRSWTRLESNLPIEGWAPRVVLKDMNDDGRHDLIASYSDGPRVWLNEGDGVWTDFSDGLPGPIVRGLFTGIAVADLNDDGLDDIAVANWIDGPEVYLQKQGGGWSKQPDVFPQMLGGAVGIDIADLDGDGRQDLVVTGRLRTDPGFVRGVYLLVAQEEGGWRWAPESGLPSTGLAAMSGVTLADLNDDGRADVIACTGLQVETTTDGPEKASLKPHVLVWMTKLNNGITSRSVAGAISEDPPRRE